MGRNDGLNGLYSTGSQIRLKTMILNSDLFDYSDAYILAKGTVTVTDTGTETAPFYMSKKLI